MKEWTVLWDHELQRISWRKSPSSWWSCTVTRSSFLSSSSLLLLEVSHPGSSLQTLSTSSESDSPSWVKTQLSTIKKSLRGSFLLLTSLLVTNCTPLFLAHGFEFLWGTHYWIGGHGCRTLFPSWCLPSLQHTPNSLPACFAHDRSSPKRSGQIAKLCCGGRGRGGKILLVLTWHGLRHVHKVNPLCCAWLMRRAQLGWPIKSF